MDQPPQDPTQPTEQPPAAPPPAVPGPAWGQPAQPAPGPAWGQPAQPAAPQAPAWGQPAQPAAPPAPGGWVQPAPVSQWVQPAAARGPVTGMAKLAGLVILLFGLAWTAFGALFAFLGGLAKVGSGSTALPGFVNGLGDIVAGFGVVLMVIAIIELLGGIGILLSKEWGRIIGIIYSLIFGVGSIFIVLGGANSRNVGNVDTSGGGFGALIFGLVFFLGYAFSLIVLMARWRSRA